MVRSLLKLAAVLIAAMLVYNYFFGTSNEKENSRKVFGQMRGVVVSVGDLLKSERAKFDAGKYDDAGFHGLPPRRGRLRRPVGIRAFGGMRRAESGTHEGTPMPTIAASSGPVSMQDKSPARLGRA